MKSLKVFLLLILLSLLSLSCLSDLTGSDPTQNKARVWSCVIEGGNEPEYSKVIGCEADFSTLASEPLDASIPGAISLKTIIDLEDNNQLYFQNSKKYTIHWDFASENLSGGELPIVPALKDFNVTEYYKPERRFILGAITRYEGPGVWTFELSPYDNASAEMINLAYQIIADSCYFGDSLYFHPTSLEIENVAKALPNSVKIKTSDQIYKGIDYQPLNYGTSYGKLVFITAKKLESEYVNFRDIVVLDVVPNDISVVNGIITQEFQTPLSHINVLSINRNTPNMGLRKAFTNSDLKKLEGKWVKLVVGPFTYSVTETTKTDADKWWEENRPPSVSIPSLDLETKELRDIGDILDLDKYTLKDALKQAIPAFGGKASHYAAFPHMDAAKVPFPKAFAIPVYYYYQFMVQNGFDIQVKAMMNDQRFQDYPSVRDATLGELRDAMKSAPVDSAFTATLINKLNNEFSGVRMRFRSSTNAEDLDGFTGAGLYTSNSGGPDDAAEVLEAIRKVWASVWYFRAYEERSYRNIDQNSVGMALLVHRSFPDEEANGVAITANQFDRTGLEPGFYINVQKGEESVVQPESGVTTDQFIFHYDSPGKPIVFTARSNLVPEGSMVLTKTQINTLGTALKEIHQFFKPLYGSDPTKWYAMDTEFKFDQPLDDPFSEPVLFMKQARPYPGWSK